jgi:hypothetical protein
MAEQNMLGVAGGLAREGYEPLVHDFAVFLYRRAFDQLQMSVSYPALRVRLLGFLPGLTTPGGVTHQAIDDLAVLTSVPGMTVVECGDAGEVASVLEVVRDETLGRELREAIAIERARTTPGQFFSGRIVELAFRWERAPTDAAFEVFLRRRDGGRDAEELSFTTLLVRQAGGPSTAATGSGVHNLPPGRYDIVLRPSVRLAEESVGFTSAWDGPDIVMEDVEFSEGEVPAPPLP